jgi:hypothetical protein
MNNPVLCANGSEFSSVPFVLNNDGKIQLGNGVVISKLGSYIKTPDLSHQTMVAYIE